MQGSLGEKIGEGAYSEAYAWAPGQVVKLFKPGLPRRMPSFEVHMIRAVHAAGAPVPEVFGEVTLDGRFGIVLTRLDGPTLLHLSRTGAMTPRQVGAILATLAMTVHKTPRRRSYPPCATGSAPRRECPTAFRSTSPPAFSA